MVHLKESRVLIVGGTSGLGLAVARAVIERGGVPFVASRRQSNVDDALAQLPGAGGIAVDLDAAARQQRPHRGRVAQIELGADRRVPQHLVIATPTQLSRLHFTGGPRPH